MSKEQPELRIGFVTPEMGGGDVVNLGQRKEHPALNGIELISFDLWKTLLRSNKAFGPAKLELIADHVGYQGDPGVLKEIMKQVDDEQGLLTDTTGVQYGFESRITAMYEMLRDVKPGVREPDLAALAEDFSAIIVKNPPRLQEEDIPETLGELRQAGFKIAVLSNTGFIDGRYMRDILKLKGLMPHINYAVFSDEVGVSKPSQEMYDQVAQQSGVSKTATVHIGDNVVADYNGAMQAGFKALHFSPDGPSEHDHITSIRELVRYGK